jgi:hypothetical protein
MVGRLYQLYYGTGAPATPKKKTTTTRPAPLRAATTTLA